MNKDTTIDSTPVSCVHEIYVLQHVRGFIIRRERYSMKKRMEECRKSEESTSLNNGDYKN